MARALQVAGVSQQVDQAW